MSGRRTVPGLNRRGFLAVSAASAAAVAGLGLAAPGAAAASAAPSRPGQSDLADAVLAAFRTTPLVGGSLGDLLDAGLYLGQPAELTASWPNPAIYLDSTYWAERHRRNAIWPVPARVDLNTYRQQQPPGYPLGQQVVPEC